MGAIIDMVALVLILLFAIVGAKKGFIRSFISFFGTLLSLIFALLLCGVVTSFLEEHFSLVTTISNSINGSISSMFGETIMNTPLSSVSEGGLSGAGIAGWIVNIIIKLQGNNLPADTTIGQILPPTFAYYIVILISIIIMYILFKIIFYIIGRIAKDKKSPFATKPDRFFGFLLGIFQGVLFVELLVLVINIIPLNFVQDVALGIKDAPFTNFLSSINLLSYIMNAVITGNYLPGFITNLISR